MKVLQTGDFIEVKKRVNADGLILNYYYLVCGIYKTSVSKPATCSYLNQVARNHRFENDKEKYLTLCMNECHYYVQLVAVLNDNSKLKELNTNYLKVALNTVLSTKLNYSVDTKGFSTTVRLKLSDVEVESIKVIRNVEEYDNYLLKAKLLDKDFGDFANDYLMAPMDVVNYFLDEYYNKFLVLTTSLGTVYKGYVYVQYEKEDALIQTCVDKQFPSFSFLTLKRVKKEDVKKELLKLLKLTLQHDSAKIREDYGKNYKIRKIANLQGMSSTSFSLDDNVIESLLKRRER